ncbi:MAG: fibronectin type III domain-containing protein [Treponema sp.]|nr:fibronectin type III domain-containing protein [Treponema sp.]
MTNAGSACFLYASRVANAQVSGTLADAGAGRSVAGLEVTLVNLNDAANTVTATTASDGTFTAQGLIPGDEYELRAAGDTARVTPGANGDHLGTLHLTGGGVNFKARIAPARIAPAGTSVNARYGYAGADTFTFTINVTNTGNAGCYAPSYTLAFEDGLATQTQSGISNRLCTGTLKPGETVSTSEITIGCTPVDADAVFKKISITITDATTDPQHPKTWTDSVSVRFFKTPVTFNAASQYPVAGLILSPLSGACRFSTAHDGTVYRSSVTMPWSSAPYLAVISGTAESSEAIYSLGINTMPQTNFSSFSAFKINEPNDTEADATLLDGQIMADIHENDIDCCTVTLGNTAPYPLSITGFALKELIDKNIVNVTPGASAYLDIRIKNNTTTTISSAQVTLSSESEYITIGQNTILSVGNLSGGYYKTLNSTQSTNANIVFFYGGSLYGTFTFSASAGCPMGTVLPLTLTFNNGGALWTDTIEVTTTAPAPANVQAAPLSNTSLAVSWDAIAGAEKYEVRYSTGSSPDTAQSVEAAAINATLSGLAANTTYSVWVRALHGAITGAFASASGKTRVNAPTAIEVTPAGVGGLMVTWTEVDGATGYDLYYSTTNDSTAATKESDVTIPHVIADLNIGTLYYVWLKAKNALGESPLSASASGVPAPAAPTGVNAVTLSDESIQVSWDSTDGAAAYDLYYHTANISSAAVRLSVVTSPHTLTGLSNGTTYYVWVKAWHDTVVTDYSTVVNTITKPGAPDGLTAAAQSLSSILVLNWNAVTGADTYTVYRADSVDGPYTTPITSGITETSYTDTGLTKETTYYYKVSAVNAEGEGALSAAVSQTTLAYQIGDTGPAGGWIFYADTTGFVSDSITCHYLEAAPADLATAYQWGGYGTLCGGTGTDIGTGATNTAALVTHNHGTPQLGSGLHLAAQACADYEYGGYDDWFLPSKDEINQMNINLKQQGAGNFTNIWPIYASSSESNRSYAWCLNSDGSSNDLILSYIMKDIPGQVRPVRAF